VIEGEVGAGEDAITQSRLLELRDVRLGAFFVRQPGETGSIATPIKTALEQAC
jgi:hypothetical protein